LLQEKTSLDIYNYLINQDLLFTDELLWWPNSGTFEVVIGALLTQNTTWKNVEKSLSNLDGFLTLDSFITLDEQRLKDMIKPSGFYNQKAPRLLALANNIHQEFISFDVFKDKVSRQWLLNQKGVGEETADSILCYGCFRDEMVVDTYTKRLLKKFGIEFKKYQDYKTFLDIGVRDHFKKNLNMIFIRYHAMIVEYNKLNS